MALRKLAKRGLTDKTCKEITNLLVDYLSGKLRSAVKRDFEHHLRICPDCVSFLKTYKKTVAASHSLTVEAIPAKLRANVLAFLRKRMNRPGAYLLFVTGYLAAVFSRCLSFLHSL